MLGPSRAPCSLPSPGCLLPGQQIHLQSWTHGGFVLSEQPPWLHVALPH